MLGIGRESRKAYQHHWSLSARDCANVAAAASVSEEKSLLTNTGES